LPLNSVPSFVLRLPLPEALFLTRSSLPLAVLRSSCNGHCVRSTLGVRRRATDPLYLHLPSRCQMWCVWRTSYLTLCLSVCCPLMCSLENFQMIEHVATICAYTGSVLDPSAPAFPGPGLRPPKLTLTLHRGGLVDSFQRILLGKRKNHGKAVYLFEFPPRISYFSKTRTSLFF